MRRKEKAMSRSKRHCYLTRQSGMYELPASLHNLAVVTLGEALHLCRIVGEWSVRYPTMRFLYFESTVSESFLFDLNEWPSNVKVLIIPIAFQDGCA